MSSIEAGRLMGGGAVTYGRRVRLQRGGQAIPNPEGLETSAVVTTFEAGLGIWRGLWFRASFPVLYTEFTEAERTGHESGPGDVSFRVGHGWRPFGPRRLFSFAISAGLFVPTGNTSRADIPSNPNFASGTVDPVLSCEGSYTFKRGLSIFGHSTARAVAYDTKEGNRSGSTIFYGLGVRYRFLRTLTPSAGVTMLHRGFDQKAQGPNPDSGGDWYYATLGLAYRFTWRPLQGLGVYTTVQVPFYQRVNGQQLVEQFNFTVGISYGFRLYGKKRPVRPAPVPPVAVNEGARVVGGT